VKVASRNPAYASAHYEQSFVKTEWLQKNGMPDNIASVPEHQLVKIPWPVRGNEFDSKGELIPIPPYIMIEV